jgi:hypothetical protein
MRHSKILTRLLDLVKKKYILLLALDFELFMFNLNNYFRRYSPAGLTYIVDFMLSLKEKEESTILKFLKCH